MKKIKMKFTQYFNLCMVALVLMFGSCQNDDIDTIQPQETAVTVPVSTGKGLTYYVAPNGNDSNAGTLSAPFLTVQKAQSVITAGDTVYIRGGEYVIPSTQVAFDDGLYACITRLDKSGTAADRIQYLAYPGEKPVFNCANVKPAGRRITAFFVKGSYITIKGIEIVGVQVTITTHTQSECFRNEGSNNIYEACKMHDGMANGFYLTRGGNNLILNCDAYNNWDSVSEAKTGGNTDGFGCHPYKQGVGYTGNTFRGCRAWNNSDDGYDCITAFEAITFENCWAFNNGYSASGASLGDGNGFKIGGFGVSTTPSVPATIPRHTIRFCLAVSNRASGFYANHHLGGSDWYNNTAYKNAINFNMLNRKADYTADVPGYGHVLKNNLDFSARSAGTANINTSLSTLNNNSWQLSVSVTSADFVSLTESLLKNSRHSDFTVPVMSFMRLVTGSDLIDKGVNLGFSYSGASPDLGCFELGINKSPIPSGPVAP